MSSVYYHVPIQRCTIHLHQTTATASAIVLQVRVITYFVHWYLFSISLDIELECSLEDIDHPAPTTMSIKIFSPERMRGETLSLEKISGLVWKHHGTVKLLVSVKFPLF